ncbi:actin binding protein [Entophlyctis luteolus]|nr:actin binding protein [Entophlyctis luteolus]
MKLLTLLVFAFGLVNARHNVGPRALEARSGKCAAKATPSVVTNPASSTCAAGVTCASLADLDVSAPHKNIWKELSMEDSDDIIHFLFRDSLGFNLTATVNATTSDNYIHSIELLRPTKAEALSYMSGASDAPKQYAKVVIKHFSWADPVYKFYKVGPLPVSSETTVTTLDGFYKSDPTRGANSCNWDTPLSVAEDVPIAATMTSIADIVLDLTGYVYYSASADNNTLEYETVAPQGADGTRRFSWVFFGVEGPASTLMPVGLQIACDFSGQDPSLYSCSTIWYNGQTWDDETAFRADWEAGKIVVGPQIAQDISWGSTDHVNGSTPELDYKKAPFFAVPDGKRYKVDKDEYYVEWMDYSFYISTDGARGLALFNIQYKGERVIYEMGLQEAIAHYAGNNPSQLSTVYLDSAYGFGRLQYQLVEGYDAPYGATYLDSWTHYEGETIIHNKSIAIFEIDSGRPIQRHLNGWFFTSNSVDSTKDIKLTVRAISTIGNYDYIIEYIFSFDGTIEYKSYLQATYYTTLEYDYGYRIHEATHGSMHDHVMNIKVDFDVGGETANSLETVTIASRNQNIPSNWYPSGMNISTNPRTMGITRAPIVSEDDARIAWPNGFVIVKNAAQNNSWGENRAYRIAPIMFATLGIDDSPFMTEGANWVHDNVAFSVYHDDERYSSDEFNQESHSKPLVNFNDFFDGESLVQQDIVTWITLGMHHVPNTQDVPTTLAHTATTSFIVTPFNYFDSEQSRRSAQILKMTYSDGETITTELSAMPSCSVNLTEYAVTDEYTALDIYNNVLAKGHKE